jgi:hypothetical protein
VNFVTELTFGHHRSITNTTNHIKTRTPRAGITIGHVLRCHPKPERWKLKMYIPMLVCFFLGAAAGKSAFDLHGRASLFLPTFFLFFLGWGYIYFLARLRRQPFHRVLLKRVSNEILTPHSPSHATARHKLRMPHMPHMPQLHIPFTHHHHNSGHGHGGYGHARGGLAPPVPLQQHPQSQQQQPVHPHHARRHSSACDKLGKGERGRSTNNGGQEQQEPQQIVLDISNGAAASASGEQDGGTNELSNHTAAVV